MAAFGVLVVTDVLIVSGDPAPFGRPGANAGATVVTPSAVGSLVFDPQTDTWMLTQPGGAQADGPAPLRAGIVLVCSGSVAVSVPRQPGLPAAPDRVGPAVAADRAYLGVLVDGVPNLFVVDPCDPDRIRFTRVCLGWMAAEGATRITSRTSVTADHGVRTDDPRRRLRKPVREEVDLSDPVLRDDGVWAGTARLASGDTVRTAPVRLSGHLEPLDGRYHWYGTIDDPHVGAEFKACRRGSVTLSVADGPAVSAAITDRTGWGTFRVEGVGVPPFPLAG